MEDNKSDVYLIRDVIAACGLEVELHVAADGEQAIHIFEDLDADDAAPCPALVLLDINLPRKQGGEVVRRIRASRRCRQIPVLVVTSSGSASDRALMASLGISGYFRKPSEYDEFLKLGEVIGELLQGRSAS